MEKYKEIQGGSRLQEHLPLREKHSHSWTACSFCLTRVYTQKCKPQSHTPEHIFTAFPRCKTEIRRRISVLLYSLFWHCCFQGLCYFVCTVVARATKANTWLWTNAHTYTHTHLLTSSYFTSATVWTGSKNYVKWSIDDIMYNSQP